MTDSPDPRLYQLAIEQTRDYALFLLAPDGRILTWGAGGRQIKGYEADEIIGRHFSVFYTREAVESGWPMHELKMAASEGRFEDEGWRVRKDGSQFWANVVITALRDEQGKLLAFSKITRNLTERRLTEEALRQSEERFRLLVNGVTDYAIYMLDLHGVVTSWNSGAERIHGYSREEMVGAHFSRFFLAEDVEAGKPWEELATARRTGRAEVEGWRVRKDGGRFWVRVILTSLYDEGGHLRGYAKVTQDLTERRHVQDLEQAARNVSGFVALLTHELRNPLAPIRAAMQVIERSAGDITTLQAMHQIINRQSHQLAHILDDMMDVSRISRGKIVIERKTVDIADVIRASLESARPLIEAGGHTLSLDVSSDLIVTGDTMRLTQLLTNILNNAARYTPAGGQITVSAQADAGNAIVKVRDTGQGVDPTYLERIFDMFVQGRNRTDRVSSGLGIGLALARNIAELHGGTLTAHSEGEDKGSEFIVRLPLAPSSQRASPAPPAAQVSVVPRRLLIVDDNIDAAATLELLLKTLGHETRVANNGAAAIEQTELFRPEIVFLDLGMADMDGYEVAKKLEPLRKRYDFQIVAVTGYGQESDKKKTKQAGFALHLVKPISVEQLIQVVNATGDRTLH